MVFVKWFLCCVLVEAVGSGYLKKTKQTWREVRLLGKDGGTIWRREYTCIANEIKYMYCVEIKDWGGTDC